MQCLIFHITTVFDTPGIVMSMGSGDMSQLGHGSEEVRQAF
jgi:hypothetical protein